VVDIAEGITLVSVALGWSGKYAESQQLAEERLAAYEAVGVRDSYGLAVLGWIELERGQYAEARAHLQTALGFTKETGNRFVAGFAYEELARVALCEGAYAEAKRLFLAGISGLEATGYADWVVRARCALAYAESGLGDPEAVRGHLREALRWTLERGSFPVLVEALPLAALLLSNLGQVELAVEFYEGASRLPVIANSRWREDLVGRPIADVAAMLPPDVVAAACERGRAHDPWAMVETLLAELG
jgi:tetratricopeptide (TPR) repeat protein